MRITEREFIYDFLSPEARNAIRENAEKHETEIWWEIADTLNAIYNKEEN